MYEIGETVANNIFSNWACTSFVLRQDLSDELTFSVQQRGEIKYV